MLVETAWVEEGLKAFFSGKFAGANAMKFDDDSLLLVRADLADQLALLRLSDFTASPVQYLLRLEGLRDTALCHQFGAVAEIAGCFENALHGALDGRGSNTMIENYTGILGEAIGASQLEPDIAQALLASVAVRLHI